MLWVLDAGLPRPLSNHAAPERRALDHARQETIERHRLSVVRIAGPDLTRYRRRAVLRIRGRREAGIQRDRALDRWSPGTTPPSSRSGETRRRFPPERDTRWGDGGRLTGWTA